jgi:cellulose biosynthesis protein BcsQ
MEGISQDLRLLFITDEEFGLTSREVTALLSEQRALLQISAHESISFEALRLRAHEAVRQPVIPLLKSRALPRHENFVAITGSSGSPGITTSALNLATEMSKLRKVELVDADPHRRDLHQKVGMQVGTTTSLTTEFSISSIDFFKLAATDGVTPSHIYFFDLGDAPNMGEIVKDRRGPAREFLDVFERCRHVVYVAQSENFSISELASFSEAVKEISSQVKVTYVLNKAGNSNRQKAIQKSFRAKVSNEAGFIFPRDYSALDRAQGQYSTLMEVTPRSSLRKAVRDLSIYLDKSI